MTEYQRKKNNKYILPQAVYLSVLWTIRDYTRLKEEADAVLYESPSMYSGSVKSSAISDPTYNKAAKREGYLTKINAIDKAKDEIPKEYRKGVWDNIQYRSAFPLDAARSTYGYYKSQFIFNVARNLKMI